MPLDPSFVGRTYPPTAPYVVGPREDPRVRRRDRRARPRLPRPGGRAALGLPGRDRPADVPGRASPWPPASSSSTTRRSGWTTAGWSTATSGSRYTRPVRAGDRLVCAITIEEIMSRAGHDFLTTRTEVTTDGRRAGRDHLVPARGARGGADDAGRCASSRRRRYRVTRADLVRYAGASGDFNPIHWSDRVATAVGLPGVIAHGMFTMALAGRAVAGWAGDPAAVVEYGVRFTKPVVVPDDDTGAEVVVRRRREARRRGRAAPRSTSPPRAAARRSSRRPRALVTGLRRRRRDGGWAGWESPPVPVHWSPVG